MRIVGGVPFVDVDAVDDSEQPFGAFAQNGIETHAVFRGLDLPRVGLAHGRQGVGVLDPRLEEVHATFVHVLLPQEAAFVLQVDGGEDLGSEHALVSDVVNRQHRS